MEWALIRSDIDWLLPQTCATIALAYLVGRADCRPKSVWLALCLCYSFDSIQRTFLYQRHWNIGVKALVGTTVNMDAVFSSGALLSVCGD